LCAHNPEVAGSNPALATNVVAGQRPFPIGRGPLSCVARDQIRDQIAGQRRLIRPTPSQAERRIEIRGTHCSGWDTWDAVAGSKPSGRTWDLAVGSLSATFHLSARWERTAASSCLRRLRSRTVAARRWARRTRTHTHRGYEPSVANSIECDLATVEDFGFLAVPLQVNGHAPCRSWGEDVTGFGV